MMISSSSTEPANIEAVTRTTFCSPKFCTLDQYLTVLYLVRATFLSVCCDSLLCFSHVQAARTSGKLVSFQDLRLRAWVSKGLYQNEKGGEGVTVDVTNISFVATCEFTTDERGRQSNQYIGLDLARY